MCGWLSVAEDLDGHVTLVLQVAGQLDRGHAALPQLALDPIAVRESGTEVRTAAWSWSLGFSRP